MTELVLPTQIWSVNSLKKVHSERLAIFLLFCCCSLCYVDTAINQRAASIIAMLNERSIIVDWLNGPGLNKARQRWIDKSSSGTTFHLASINKFISSFIGSALQLKATEKVSSSELTSTKNWSSNSKRLTISSDSSNCSDFVAWRRQQRFKRNEFRRRSWRNAPSVWNGNSSALSLSQTAS